MEEQDQELETPEKRPLKPWAAVLITLFVYPGVAHFMLGARKAGAVLLLLFTLLTGGLLYEIFLLAKPLLLLMLKSKPMETTVDWPRILFWIVGSSLLWVGGALHSGWLASQQSE